MAKWGEFSLHSISFSLEIDTCMYIRHSLLCAVEGTREKKFATAIRHKYFFFSIQTPFHSLPNSFVVRRSSSRSVISPAVKVE